MHTLVAKDIFYTRWHSVSCHRSEATRFSPWQRHGHVGKG